MKRVILAVGIIGLTLVGCSSDDDSAAEVVIDNSTEASAVIENYADLVLANYQAALVDAEAMNVAIQTFVTTPTEENFEAAKEAWLTSRESYGPSEAFRFANGPIDTGDTEEIEGYLNSWPLDEAYIDYVEGDETAGIVNNAEDFPIISKEILTGENGNGGEENVAIGYHAIEFLLWGQDLTAPSENLAGQRVYTDFVDGGTAANQDRRRDYLAVVADLLTDHLQVVIEEWTGDYRSTFLALDEDEALDNMISSIAELSRSELAIERMAVALQNQDQEDEHSCFSDNTDRDIRLNLAGIVNVYTGAYGNVSGSSIQDLVEEADADLASELDALLATAVADVDATLDPFDLAIVDGESSVEGAKVQTAVQALVAFGDKLLEAKVALDID
ncbi:imelysin family protein [Maribacter sp. SA7]|uniref:imelysin family protein n=1 Tax=Maribacter zhoushanensis TaxID=3030012 RepID=UPI0023EBDB01|nr:imelysin family protein [Maribacter zhoushanensis]MDF4203391.1 imelysin family protein [Maribacter zhoushanensis]